MLISITESKVDFPGRLLSKDIPHPYPRVKDGVMAALECRKEAPMLVRLSTLPGDLVVTSITGSGCRRAQLCVSGCTMGLHVLTIKITSAPAGKTKYTPPM